MLHFYTFDIYVTHLFQYYFPETDNNVAGIRDQRVWTVQECANNLHNALSRLKVQLSQQGENGLLVWDKVCHCAAVAACYWESTRAVISANQISFH